MKRLFLVALFVLGTNFANAQENKLIGLAGIYTTYHLGEEIYGGGFEVAGIKKSGFGAQIEYFPADSLSLTSARGFIFWPITKEFFIKTALGTIIKNSEEKRYPDYALSVGVGFTYTKSKVYLGIQSNLNFVEIAPTVSIHLGLKFD